MGSVIGASTNNALVSIVEIFLIRHITVVYDVRARGVEETFSMDFVRVVPLKLTIIHSTTILIRTYPTTLKMILIFLLRTLVTNNRVSMIIHTILKIVGDRLETLIMSRIRATTLMNVANPHNTPRIIQHEMEGPLLKEC